MLYETATWRMVHRFLVDTVDASALKWSPDDA